MRDSSTSTPRIAAPCIVAASGCAPPMPPSPAVSTKRPASDAAEVLARDRAERLVRALHDPLRADVDPRARGHLAVHHQARALELAEVLPRRPAADEVAVRDQHARRARVRAEHADRLAALHEQRLVVARASRSVATIASNASQLRAALPGPAVHHQIVRPLGDLGVEVVHQHPQRGFLLPALAARSSLPRGARTGRAPARCAARGHASPSCDAPARTRPRRSRRRARAMSPREHAVALERRDERAHARVRARRRRARLERRAEVEPLRGAHQLDREHVRARSATTRRSFHAAPIAIGTTSSLLPSVGIVSTLAGCDSTLHSLASAAAVTCAIMKPEFTPGVAREERRQPLVEVRDAPAGRCAARTSSRGWSARSRASRAPSRRPGRGSCRRSAARRPRTRAGCRSPR